MVESTVAYLAQNEAVWKANPAFTKAVADLERALATTQAASDDQGNTTRAEAGGRFHLRETLEDITSEIADQLFALSEETGDLGLAAATDFTRASLDRLPDDKLEHTAKHVCELAGMHLGALANYLVIAADVAELATLITEFAMARSEPSAHGALTASAMEERLRFASRILRGRLDKLVSRYRGTASEFVSGYHHVRMVSGPALPGPATRAPLPRRRPPIIQVKGTPLVHATHR